MKETLRQAKYFLHMLATPEKGGDESQPLGYGVPSGQAWAKTWRARGSDWVTSGKEVDIAATLIGGRSRK